MAKAISNPAKRKAWEKCQRYHRVKGCIETGRCPFVGICYTCGHKYHIVWLQAGHGIPGRSNSVLFMDEVIRIQCKGCNENHNGRIKKFQRLLREEYGDDTFDLLLAQSKLVIHTRDMNFPEIAASYLEKTNEMLKPFGYPTYEAMMKV